MIIFQINTIRIWSEFLSGCLHWKLFFKIFVRFLRTGPFWTGDKWNIISMFFFFLLLLKYILDFGYIFFAFLYQNWWKVLLFLFFGWFTYFADQIFNNPDLFLEIYRPQRWRHNAKRNVIITWISIIQENNV